MFDAPIEAAARAIEAIAALVLTWGAATTFAAIVWLVARDRMTDAAARQVWLRLARWLVLSLEFQLASDVLHTAVAPTWTEIGRVAALAVIRTFLNRALEGDLEKASAKAPAAAPEA
jgi:uncharacterized membrane protein